MIGVDTNVLIRYIVQDDPRQSKLATQLIEKKLSAELPGFISHLTLCEVVWVLERAYQYPKSIVLKVIQQILSTAEFEIESPSVAWETWKAYQKGKADFSDYLISRINQFQGCDYTVTFDKKAAQEDAFKLLR